MTTHAETLILSRTELAIAGAPGSESVDPHTPGVKLDAGKVRHGDDETRVLVCELLEEDYKAQDRYEKDLNVAWNTGDGAYRP